MASKSLNDYLQELGATQGWLYDEDILVFQEINAFQKANGINGDLLEIGVYHGKTAILMGYLIRNDEQLVVCDLFQAVAKNPANQAEKEVWYPQLTRKIFEENYLRFHSDLPAVVAYPSTSLPRVGRLRRTFRFIHIDGSHIFSVVRQDIRTTKTLLIPNGIVTIDDYRSIHTPGVAAASWHEVTSGNLIPLCLTPQKMYATWNPSNEKMKKHLMTWANNRNDVAVEVEPVCGRKLLRLQMKA